METKPQTINYLSQTALLKETCLGKKKKIKKREMLIKYLYHINRLSHHLHPLKNLQGLQVISRHFEALLTLAIIIVHRLNVFLPVDQKKLAQNWMRKDGSKYIISWSNLLASWGEDSLCIFLCCLLFPNFGLMVLDLPVFLGCTGEQHSF